MTDQSVQVVFLNSGTTLGFPEVSPPPPRLVGLHLYPFVPKVLEELRTVGLRLGLIAETGALDDQGSLRQVLEGCGIYQLFEPTLLLFSSVEGLPKTSRALFERAADRAGLSDRPDRCMFVDEDSWERRLALEAGFRVASHPLLVSEMLKGSQVRYIRVIIPASQRDKPWARVVRSLSVIPLQVTRENGVQVVAIATTAAIARLLDNGFAVTQLLGDPLATDLYLLRDDQQSRTGFLVEKGQAGRFFALAEESDWVQFSTQEGLCVTLPNFVNPK